MKLPRLTRAVVNILTWAGAFRLQPALAAPSPVHDQARPGGPSELSLQQLVDRGIAAYQAGQFEVAAGRLQQALAQNPPLEQRARLSYNLGASLLQLQRWGSAEACFVEAAKLSEGEDRSLARIQAGFAALAAGAVERAEEHYGAVTELGEQSRPLARALREQLSQRHSTEASPPWLRQRLEQAYELLGTDDLERAEAHFQAVRSGAKVASVRADAVYGLALVAERRGQWEQAARLAQQALSLDSSRWEALWLLGSISQQRGDRISAAKHWQQALQFELPDTARRQILSAQAASDPRPASGIFGHWQWGAGYDSNATQAGAAASSGLSNAAATQRQPALQQQAAPSAQAQVSILVGHARRLQRAWLLRTLAQASHWALFRSSAQQASVGQVDLSLEVRHWASSSLQFSGRVFGGHSRTGLWGGTPFTSFAGMAGEGRWQLASGWHSRASVEYQGLTGHEANSALTGDRFGVLLEESFQGEAADVGLRLGGQIYWAGELSVLADPALLPLCSRANSTVAASCEFEVPLSFRALSASLFAGYETLYDVSLRGEVRVEARDFWRPSRLVVGPGARTWPGSEKQRQDVGMRIHLEVGWSPSQLEPVTVWGQYQGQHVRSNLQPDRTDPAHRFDYEDRNYTQHSLLLGARFDWD